MKYITTKNIDDEINRLIKIRTQVHSFNKLKESNPDVVAISKCKFDEFMHNHSLNKDTIYCTFDDEIAQYIDGCIT